MLEEMNRDVAKMSLMISVFETLLIRTGLVKESDLVSALDEAFAEQKKALLASIQAGQSPVH